MPLNGGSARFFQARIDMRQLSQIIVVVKHHPIRFPHGSLKTKFNFILKLPEKVIILKEFHYQYTTTGLE